MVRSIVASGLAPVMLLAGCAAGRRKASIPAQEPGRAHFQSYCAACHQYDGQGVGSAPPLDRSPWVTGPETRLIKIVLHGLQGAMEIQGKSYDLEMPGFGQILPDTDIASLLTFVRRRFGGPSDAVSPDTVHRVREAYANRTGYWKVDELLAEP